MTTAHLISAGFQHAAEAVQAAAEVGVPLYIVAAMLEKESRGANVYGDDRGGVFNKADPARPPGGVVTEENYRIFEKRVFAGETSNGVGPAQITYPGFIKDAHARAIFLWKPLDNIKYGVSLLKEYLNGSETDDAIRYAGQRYNGAAAYGEDLLLRARQWQTRLSEEFPMAKNHPVSAIATLETELRRRGYTITCGPSFYKDGRCAPGKHGHMKGSTHFIGGAVDVSKDPAPGVPISTFEKAHLDDLARELMSRGFRVIWGVANHFDHLHADFNLYGVGGGHQVVFQGPNAGFSVAHILDVQTQLKKLGLYTGALDGLRGNGTIKAVKTFQTREGLTADGLPGATTVKALKAAVSKPAPAPADSNAGFSAEHIRWVQTSLKTLGYYTDAIDGTRGPKTQAAIKAFQKKAGLTADGLPGDGTTAAIKKALAPKPPVKTLEQRVEPFRLSGRDAYETAEAIRTFSVPSGRGVLVVARDTTDHIQAGILAGRHANVEVIPVPNGGGLKLSNIDAIKRIKPSWLRVVGGATAIPSPTAYEALTTAGIKVP